MKSLQIRALEDMLIEMSINSQLRDKNIVVSSGLASMIMDCKSVTILQDDQKLINGKNILFAKLEQINLWINSEINFNDTGLYNLDGILIFSIKGLEI